MVNGCPADSEVQEFVEGRLSVAATSVLQQHLDGCNECRELVAGVADQLLVSAATDDIPIDQLLRGTLIGRYTVLSRVAAGGMGAVYAAYDPELDRKVAVKVLRTDLLARADPELLRARMTREAQAMARLNHPNVVTVYDVGALGSEVFIAMEFVEGTTFGAWLRAHQPGWREILDRYLLAGEGLAAAHRADLVHRDFKPDNVFVGHDGHVRVGDFGLARMHAGDTPTSSSGELGDARVSTATFCGTPGYMAPEQRNGEIVDARADQFSFCRALDEALFDGRDTGAPAWLRAPLARGQRIDREERWRTMDELLLALRRDPARQNRRWVGGAAVVGLAGVAVFGIARELERAGPTCASSEEALVGVWDPEVRERVRERFAASDRHHAVPTFERLDATLSAYVSAWAAMRTETCEATHVHGEQSAELFDLRMRCLDRHRSRLAALTGALVESERAPVDEVLSAAARLPRIDDCADADALRAGVPLPADPAVRAAIDVAFAELDRLWALALLGRTAEILEPVQLLAMEAKRLSYAPLELKALSTLSDVQDALGDYASAEATILAALQSASAAHDDVGIGITLIKLMALVGAGSRRFPEARMIGRLAEAALLRANSPDEDLAGLYSVIGLVARLEGRLADAKAAHQRALDLIDGVPHVLIAARAAERSNFAATLGELGEHEAGDALLEEALAMMEAEYGADHPIIAAIVMNLGASFNAQSEHVRACEAYERALGIWERAYGPDHPNVADVLDNLSVAERARGRFAEARAHSERAIAIFTKTVGPEHPEIADARLNYGYVLRDQGQLADAVAQFERALAIYEKALGNTHPDVAYALTAIGECHLDRRRAELAVAPLERALALREGSEGDPTLAAETRALLVRARRAVSAAGSAERSRRSPSP